MSTLSIQRDPRVWGPDAQIFDPMRWMDSDPRSQKGYPFGITGLGKAAFPAFHLGPRSVSDIEQSWKEVSSLKYVI